MKKKIKVHVADDHMILIEGIIAMLNTDADIKVVGHSLTGIEVKNWFRENEADVLVLDINMPELDGIEVLKWFDKRHSQKKKYQKIIMLSSYDNPKLVKELTTYGADGFISKTSAGEHIIKSIKSVYNNVPYFSEDIKEGLFNLEFGNNLTTSNLPDNKVISSLTERELDIIRLVIKEYNSYEIAEMLSLSVSTIETYRKKLLKKLNVKNVVGLAMFVAKNKIM